MAGGLRQRYGLRWERRWRVARGRWKRRELRPAAGHPRPVPPRGVLVFSVMRDEATRLDAFLAHYRGMGAAHFLIVDNGSSDGTDRRLAREPDVSLWRTGASYAASGCGTDWLNGLLCRHGHGRWTLSVDADELLVYPYCDSRPLPALCDWLEAGGKRSMAAMLIDLYPRGPVCQRDDAGADADEPVWFDPANYVISVNRRYRNLWIQGGPRMRAFFADAPKLAPALNKIPLVRWDRSYAYVASTHALLPRGLNLVYGRDGGEMLCGALLHTKFTAGFVGRARQEAARGEHFDGAREYRRYARGGGDIVLWTPQSARYRDWRQLDALGLISAGGWA